MSIHDLYHKIKGEMGIDNMTIMYLLVVIGVGISAFGLGRLSVTTEPQQGPHDISITQTASVSTSFPRGQSLQGVVSASKSSVTDRSLSVQGNYVASKNGKLYYPNGCKGVNRIKEENRVWFDTKEDAESLGYAWATSCK